MIGELFRYASSKQTYKLVYVSDYIYHFACGHWCTDCVFDDLINVTTGVTNYKKISTK